MAASMGSPLPVVGVSGILSGLLAALLWLELRFPDVMPAWWRVPRRALFGVIGLTALLSLLPFVAAAAHAGGFVGGGIAAMAVAWNGPRNRPAGIGLRAIAGTSTAVTLGAIAIAASQLIGPGDFKARHGVRLERLAGVSAVELNDAAWAIAIDEGSPPELLEVALQLAERAVVETEHADPEILDTLAEVHFQLGHRDEAVAAIEEAIQRDPGDAYYREQRRRFLGERDAEDRPDPQAPQPESHPEPPGLSV
jgi:tetratricopeptide (TPR) repeat protein